MLGLKLIHVSKRSQRKGFPCRDIFLIFVKEGMATKNDKTHAKLIDFVE